MIDKYKQPCFDSTVFIGKLKEEICKGIKRHTIFDWLWQKAQNGEFKVFISAITLAEVYKPKLIGTPTEKTKSSHIDLFLELIEEDFVEVIEVSRKTGLLANTLCRNYDLKPADALIIACSIEAKCDVVVCWDKPMIGKNLAGIRIEEPCIYTPDLFTAGTEKATPQEIETYEKKNGIYIPPAANKSTGKPVNATTLRQ